MRLHTIARGVTVLTIAAAAIGGLCPEVSAQAQAPRNVLAINWGAEDFPGSEPLNAAIRKVLDRSVVPVNYFAEYLESEEFPAETASISLRDYIQQKYEGRHIDVVIAVASAALQFALRYREELFPGVPIVFLAVAPPQVVVNRTATGVRVS